MAIKYTPAGKAWAWVITTIVGYFAVIPVGYAINPDETPVSNVGVGIRLALAGALGLFIVLPAVMGMKRGGELRKSGGSPIPYGISVALGIFGLFQVVAALFGFTVG